MPPQLQPAAPNRARDRFISLPEELQGVPTAAEEVTAGIPTVFEDLVQEGAGLRGRIACWCVAEGIDRKALELHLRERETTTPLHSFPDVVYGRYESVRPSGEIITGDIFYFDYGVIVLWNLTPDIERVVVRSVVGPVLVDPLPSNEVEVDEFSFHYTASEKPNISNDTFTSRSSLFWLVAVHYTV